MVIQAKAVAKTLIHPDLHQPFELHDGRGCCNDMYFIGWLAEEWMQPFGTAINRSHVKRRRTGERAVLSYRGTVEVFPASQPPDQALTECR